MTNKIFIPVAAFALMLAGCAKETIETAGDDNKPVIAYKSSLGRNAPTADTRAGEINDAQKLIDAEAELPVYVYFSSGNGQLNTKWKYWTLEYYGDATPPRWSYNGTADNDEFHPAENLMHFSVWPVTNVTTTAQNGLDNVNTATGAANFTYTVPTAHDEQEDLLVALGNSSVADPVVNLTYKHALSQINFSVVGLAGVKITISNIHLGGVWNRAIWEYNSAWETARWKDWGQVGDGNYEYYMSSESDLSLGRTFTTTGDADTDTEYFFGNHDAGTIGQKDVRHSNSLMLLPQSFSTGGNQNAWFEFDYVTTNMQDVQLSSGTKRVLLKDVQIENAAPEWKKQSRYRYTIRFSTPKTISYTVQVDQWTSGNQAPIAPVPQVQ